MEDIIIRKIQLPVHVKAFTVTDAQGDYNVYLNSLLSDEQQMKSFMHEKKHIENDDFFKEADALVIEAAMK